MTDDELTRLAALAYGDAPAGFSPLTDDGDALRLAVKLQLRVMPQEKCAYVESNPESILSYAGAAQLEMNGSDPYAAIRRAIVRAASIGEANGMA